MAGGRPNVELGLQTGLDIVAMLAWWDRNASLYGDNDSTTDLHSHSGFNFPLEWWMWLPMLLLASAFFVHLARTGRLPDRISLWKPGDAETPVEADLVADDG
jgi:hypothetical protein